MSSLALVSGSLKVSSMVSSVSKLELVMHSETYERIQSSSRCVSVLQGVPESR